MADRINEMRRPRSRRSGSHNRRPETASGGEDKVRRRYAGEPTSGDTTVVLVSLGLVGSLVGMTIAWWAWDERREKRLRAELARERGDCA